MNEEMRDDLNERQYEAVTAVDGPVLVIAGAGSGKTRVIEYRVAHLVGQGVDPASILLLAFTRKSAREMVLRAAARDGRCNGVEGGTFHSFANRILRKHGRLLGLSGGFTIYDESDAEEAIHRLAVKLGFYDKEKRRPRKEMVRSIFSMALNKEIPIEQVLERHYPEFVGFAEELKALRTRYMEYKIGNQCLDYDDLLLYLKLLLRNGDARRRIAERYRYIMVDEFQDTNPMQGEIAYLLAEGHGNILAVGDDAQSIYSFRGGSHRNIMEFPERFPACRLITLEDNYRSTQAILDLGNAVLDSMAHGYRKCLKAVKTGRGAKPRLVFFRDAVEEAGWVADRIKEFCDQGMELSHQCILFRSAYITIPLQSELTRRNIPFELYGGLRFYETGHVKDLVALLKLAVNPRDELAWSRVLLMIPGIGPRTAERMIDRISTYLTLDSVIEEVLSVQGGGRSYSEGIERLKGLLEVMSAVPPAPVCCQAAVDYYAPLMREKFDMDWHLRNNDLDTLVQMSGRHRSVEEFLADIAIEPPERAMRELHDTVWERPLILSTIHSAKGLEWRHVFLVGAMEGVLPSSYATHDEEALEEEQRLLYVAITRARERLYILLHHESRKNGMHMFNRLSRFLDTPRVKERLDRDYPSLPPLPGRPGPDAIGEAERSELLAKLLDSLK